MQYAFSKTFFKISELLRDPGTEEICSRIVCTKIQNIKLTRVNGQLEKKCLQFLDLIIIFELKEHLKNSSRKMHFYLNRFLCSFYTKPV